MNKFSDNQEVLDEETNDKKAYDYYNYIDLD